MKFVEKALVTVVAAGFFLTAGCSNMMDNNKPSCGAKKSASYKAEADATNADNTKGVNIPFHNNGDRNPRTFGV